MSTYLNYLPAIFREHAREHPFIAKFLLAIEAVLTGLDKTEGLEQIISRASNYLDLDPQTTPEEFLPWLGGWVALSLRADWDEDTKRGFIQEIVPLYRQRGTLTGLQQILEIYLRPMGNTQMDISDQFDHVPHFFQVKLTLSDTDDATLRETQKIARAIIDQEKPAHTFYALEISTPELELGDNTVLG
jgi:phage tail-like protein